jgi:hypothetical protein
LPRSTLKRTRPIATAPACGGQACPVLFETKARNCTEAERTGEWSTCDKGCGSGRRFRYAEHVRCSTSSVLRTELRFLQNEKCNTQACLYVRDVYDEAPSDTGTAFHVHVDVPPLPEVEPAQPAVDNAAV